MRVRVEPLWDLAAAGVADLVADSEREGLRLVRRLVDEWDDAANRFDRPGEALFGAFLERRLVGVCGLNIDPYASNDRVGRVRHLYVLTDARHAGVARALMAQVIAAGRQRFGQLRLRTNNPAAARLYESLGFRPTPEAVDSTHVLPLGSIALVSDAYAAFNARDVDRALAAMQSHVEWPNGMEGGSVHGHRELREYWTRQWTLIDPHVEPVRFTEQADGRIVVEVHQVVRDLAGAVKADQIVQHVYRLRDGLIAGMEIRRVQP